MLSATLRRVALWHFNRHSTSATTRQRLAAAHRLRALRQKSRDAPPRLPRNRVGSLGNVGSLGTLDLARRSPPSRDQPQTVQRKLDSPSPAVFCRGRPALSHPKQRLNTVAARSKSCVAKNAIRSKRIRMARLLNRYSTGVRHSAASNRSRTAVRSRGRRSYSLKNSSLCEAISANHSSRSTCIASSHCSREKSSPRQSMSSYRGRQPSGVA
jgi:hypothetical protein